MKQTIGAAKIAIKIRAPQKISERGWWAAKRLLRKGYTICQMSFVIALIRALAEHKT